MRIHRLVATAALGALALAACGSGSYSSGSATSKPAAPVRDQHDRCRSGEDRLVVVGRRAHRRQRSDAVRLDQGQQWHADVHGCVRDRVAAVDGRRREPARGLDAKIFSVVARPDGTHQLKAGKWPLYRFAGDAGAGDVNGQGTAGFFVVMPNGSLNKG